MFCSGAGLGQDAFSVTLLFTFPGSTWQKNTSWAWASPLFLLYLHLPPRQGQAIRQAKQRCDPICKQDPVPEPHTEPGVGRTRPTRGVAGLMKNAKPLSSRSPQSDGVGRQSVAPRLMRSRPHPGNTQFSVGHSAHAYKHHPKLRGYSAGRGASCVPTVRQAFHVCITFKVITQVVQSQGVYYHPWRQPKKKMIISK